MARDKVYLLESDRGRAGFSKMSRLGVVGSQFRSGYCLSTDSGNNVSCLFGGHTLLQIR